MGYSFGWNSRKELTDYLKESNHALASRTFGSTLWMVCETPEGEKWIACCLISGHGDDWGYKGMEESMHPFYYSCPLEFLGMVPEKCADWREKVRTWHAEQAQGKANAKAFTEGMRIRLPEGWKVREFTLHHKEGRLWRAYGCDGRYYRIPQKAIFQAEIVA